MPVDEDQYDVLCYGTISVDNVIHVPYLPSPRRDVQAISEHDELGGEALKVALPLAAWGLRVLAAGNVIGTDRRAKFILEELSRHPDLDARYIRQDPGVATPFARVIVTPDGERSRITSGYEKAPQTELTAEMMQQARLLSVDAYGCTERERAASAAHVLGKRIITADAIWPQSPLASLSDAVIISGALLKLNFPGAYEYDHALALQQQGAGVVIITDGPRPVLVVRADGSPFGVEPYEIRDVGDTSSAGTMFKAGIIYSWLQAGWSLEHAVRFACAAAGLSCQRRPKNAPLPSLAEIAALMAGQPR